MMKKILFVNDLVRGGGAEQVMLDLILYLSSQKDYSIVVHANDERNEASVLFPTDVVFLPASWSAKFPLNKVDLLLKIFHRLRTLKICLWYFRRKLRRHNFDVIIAMKEGFPTKLVAGLSANRKIGWVHIDYNYVYGTKAVYASAVDELHHMKQFSTIVCVSQSTKNSIIKKIGDPLNLRVLYNPINVEYISARGQQLIEVSKPADRLVFVAIGRLSAEKGFDRLLKAVHMSAVKDKFDVWIIGDGPKKDELQKLKLQFGLKNVYFFGHQSNPYKFLSKADWFICPSHFESYGLAIQEALLLNIPVITTDFRASREVVSPDFALIVDNSVQGIARGIDRVVLNPVERRKFADVIRARFSRDVYEARLLPISEMLFGLS